jgi:hypothetical protein
LRVRAVVGIVIVALEPILNPVWVALVTGVVPSQGSLAGGGIIVASVVGYALHQAAREHRLRARARAIERAEDAARCNPLILAFVVGATGIAAALAPGHAAAADCVGVTTDLETLRARQLSEGHAPAQAVREFDPPAGTIVRGAALVAHGLNLLPSRMDAIAVLLSEAGWLVTRAALAGHGGNGAVYRSVTRGRFLDDLHGPTCRVVARAREASKAGGPLPAVFVGFSLGALVTQDLINGPAFTRPPFAAQVLLAPAIAVKPFTHVVRALTFLPWLSLPSLSLESHRAARGTTLAAYAALFDSRAALLHTPMDRSRIPTLVLVHPDDELVSLPGTRELIAEKGLMTWEIETVDKAGHAQPRTVNHLIIDPGSFSAREWTRVSKRLLRFLP